MNLKAKKAFFSLLRISLFRRLEEVSDFESLSENEWNEVFEISKSQALIAVIYDGVAALPKDLQPSKSLLIKWFLNMQKIEQSNLIINNSVKLLADIMKQESLDFILIKGQSLAALYPEPLHRQCGDIDIVVTENDTYKKMYRFFCDYTKTNPAFKIKHVSFPFNGTLLEIHKNVMNLHNPFRLKKVKSLVDTIIKRDGYPHYICNEREIKELPYSVNAVYILKHAFDHLVTFGVGLRQICDWTIFMQAYKDKLDNEEVTKLLKLCSLYDAANMFAYISVNYMGMAIEDLPFKYIENKEQGEFLMNDILSGGNFGTFRKGYNVNKNVTLRKINTATSIIKRSLMFLKFSPAETLWFPFVQIYKVSLSLFKIQA